MEEAEARTLGAFLHKRRAGADDPNAIPHVRTRVVTLTAEDGKASEAYDFYPDRQMLEDEFAAIWQAQSPHHPEVLTEEPRAQFYEIIFHQRPLRKPKDRLLHPAAAGAAPAQGASTVPAAAAAGRGQCAARPAAGRRGARAFTGRARRAPLQAGPAHVCFL
ncbi:hypothetical protein KHC27_19985 [Ancylobacter lacus]|nr:hypothetical protein [Ancylobacter lacus]MBS7541217.1 hypothetical protein [Ancylobacter lacus]